MINKLLTSLLLTISCSTYLIADNNYYYSKSSYPIQCAPQLRECLAIMQTLPEVQRLIAQIQQEGPIRIEVTSFVLAEQFGAYWDYENRVICVNLTTRPNQGALIGSLLFELQNAAITSDLLRLDHLASTGQIDRDTYVEAVEHLEFQNSKRAAAIADKGIQMGIFPQSAHLNTYNTFKEHFEIQKWAGHSDWIAKTFDEIAPKRANLRR